MFGDFGEIIEGYDWIDMSLFMFFSFMTLILFTNILIAYMGDAHREVKETMDIVTGQGTADLLVELETIFAFINACCCHKLKKDKEGYILCAEYEEDYQIDPTAINDQILEEIKGMKEDAKNDK